MPEQPTQEKPKEPKDEKSLQKLKEGASSYAKYMSAGFQLVGPVLLGALIGYWIDESQHNAKPIWTIILSSVMIVVGLYLFIKQFLKN